jgi:hypothetical protein
MLLPSPSERSIEEFEGSATGAVVRNEQAGECGFAVFSGDLIVRRRN